MAIQSKSPQAAPQTLKDVRVLIVDDEDLLAWSIDTELRGLGAETVRAGSVREAIERFQGFNPDLAITDLRLPDGNGLELVKKWRHEAPEMPVILVTAHGAIDSAVTALRLGACDYLQKPFDMKDLIAATQRAAEIGKLRQKVGRLAGREAGAAEVEIVGETPAIQQLKDELRRIARSKANTALILGESGTGKELAARAIHEWSERRGQPFVEINCASIPETLLESELFGYEKGAFTDARERKLGLFEVARNGSVFLDEIGEMPLKLQAKLLRALEYRRFKRLGGTKDIEFTGRIIAATNRNLLEEAAEKRFRADLYYRLSALPVQVPLLRDRLADLPGLCQFFLAKLASELDLRQPRLSPAAVACLQRHSWPGNVRELRNVLERAMIFYEPEVLEPRHLRLDPVPEGVTRPAPQPAPADASWPAAGSTQRVPQPAPACDPASRMGVDQSAAAPGALAADGDLPLARPEAPPPAAVANGNGLQAAHQVPAAYHPSAPLPGVAGDGGATTPLHLEPQASYYAAAMANGDAAQGDQFRLPPEGVKLEELERSLLVQALERARQNQTRAAQLLGITRHTLRYRMEKHGLLAPNSAHS